MKFVMECIPVRKSYPRRYLLLSDVSDEDAAILTLCNMIRAPDYDNKCFENEVGIECEAWMVM